MIEELNAQREARAQQQVSLVESIREQENLERETDREKREELYRKAFGVSSSDSDPEDGEEVIPDIILDEAAKVLSDIIG